MKWFFRLAISGEPERGGSSLTRTGVVAALALTVLLSTFAVQPLGAQGTPS
jgi:hypothetical protein